MSIILSRQVLIPINKKYANEYQVGDTILLKENGNETEYIIVHQGRPSTDYSTSCNGCWILRKDIITTNTFTQNNNSTRFELTDLYNDYLKAGFLNYFNTTTKSYIKNIKIPYDRGGGLGVGTGENGFSCQIFLLSGYEMGFAYEGGWMPTYVTKEGDKLNYFDLTNAGSVKRVCQFNNQTNLSYYTRTLTSNGDVWGCTCWGGALYDLNPYDSNGVRPAMVLKNDTPFDADTNILLE